MTSSSNLTVSTSTRGKLESSNEEEKYSADNSVKLNQDKNKDQLEHKTIILSQLTHLFIVMELGEQDLK